MYGRHQQALRFSGKLHFVTMKGGSHQLFSDAYAPTPARGDWGVLSGLEMRHYLSLAAPFEFCTQCPHSLVFRTARPITQSIIAILSSGIFPSSCFWPRNMAGVRAETPNPSLEGLAQLVTPICQPLQTIKYRMKLPLGSRLWFARNKLGKG